MAQKGEKLPQVIIYAPRDERFTLFIENLLSKCELKEEHFNTIRKSEVCMKRFKDAFTHESADSLNNYQFLEKLGDCVINAAIRFYIIKKFPELHKKEGVEYISELESAWKSKAYLSSFADSLNFKDFISADEDSIKKNIRSRSEDCFEAFIGALELNVDDIVGELTGYGVCYKFIKKLLDGIEIDYTYEQLSSSKSRLNEL
jgi:dsRNA-specific ribonuclease